MSFARFAVLLLVAIVLRDALFQAAGLPEAERLFSWHKLAELTSLIGIVWVLEAAFGQLRTWQRKRAAG